MSKKMMLLALAVAAIFAIPSAASAQEIHFSGVTDFTGSGGAGFLAASGEPKISCTSNTSNGKFDSGSSTTGTITIVFKGCTAEFFGIKGNCNTLGDTTGIITSHGTFHLITTVANGVSTPDILITPTTTTIICSGFSRVEVTGNGVIGKITSPKCGQSSNTMGVTFEAEGSTQKQIEYTGKKYDLSAHTENSSGETTGASGTAALSGSNTIESPTEGTLECT
jgi:hypothetical protein